MSGLFSSHPGVGHAAVAERIEAVLNRLPKQEAQVAQYLLLNLNDLPFQTGASIARAAGTSEVTVSRLLNRLGYRGMAGLKRELRGNRDENRLRAQLDDSTAVVEPTLRNALETEVRGLANVYAQAGTERWQEAVSAVSSAGRVLVTGFQTVRGLAEDFSRRLALVRGNVQFFSAHDGMLCEWLTEAEPRTARDCLILIDVVPYAREAPVIAQQIHATQQHLVILSDEHCHWARALTRLVFHAPSGNGLLFESMGALLTMTNVLAHGVATREPERTASRRQHWQTLTRRLQLF